MAAAEEGAADEEATAKGAVAEGAATKGRRAKGGCRRAAAKGQRPKTICVCVCTLVRSALRVPPAETRLTVYRRLEIRERMQLVGLRRG